MLASWVLLEMLCMVVGTCAWGEEGRGFVDAGGWMYLVGELPQGFLTCSAPKQILWPQSHLLPARASSWVTAVTWAKLALSQGRRRDLSRPAHGDLEAPGSSFWEGEPFPYCCFALVSAEDLLHWAQQLLGCVGP